MELEIAEKRATVGRTATATKSQNEPHITMNFNCNPATTTASTVAITTTAAGNKQQKESQKKRTVPSIGV